MGPRSPSRSSGATSSGDEEKAISTTANRKRISDVNNSTRHTSSSQTSRHTKPGDLSTDKDVHFRDDDGVVRQRPTRPRTRSPYRRNRSRSRSPYRAGKAASGEKRKGEEDHYTSKANSDPRRFKIHYEGSTSSRNGDQMPTPHGHRGSKGYEQSNTSGRTRDRSRSPYRRSHTDHPAEKRGRNRDRIPEWPNTDRATARDQGRGSVLSVDERESAVRASQAENDTKLEASMSHQTAADRKVHAVNEPEDDEPPKQFSEAEIIEQRRKKREAIKAKHKSQSGLLVQALEQNMTSTPSTPAFDSSASFSAHSPPSSIGSPQTPYRDSPPASPASFAVENDDELANHHQTEGNSNDDEGPSAADYDPNMDMQEDRPDHKRPDQDVPANGMPNTDGQPEPEPTQDPSKEFDMFADDDDDDDMFAPADQPTTTKSTKHAQTLDQSLLDNWDYPDGHYRIILGELLDGRYAVQQQVGKGTFATVVRAQDTRTGKDVAVKIACNNETMFKAGQKEMDMLTVLNQSDPEDKKHIIRLERDFVHKGHLCLVFENLNADLREVLKKFGRNVGLNLKAIRSFGQQMFLALSHMKKCQILHADLKPDNILVNGKRNLLKVCDLGTAAFANDAEITPYLVSRFYRAPEVILGMPFDFAIDMWSIGCTLYELYTGRILFAGADNNQMLRAIQECRGKFPIRMLKRSSLADRHFDLDANFFSQETDKITGKAVIRQMNFNKSAPGKDLKARLGHNAQGLSPAELTEHAAFVDLMEKCLQLDPARRISPNDALRHHFIMHSTAPVRKPTAKPLPTLGMPRKR